MGIIGNAGRLPGDGWRLIDVRHELPDAWQRLKERAEHDTTESRLDVQLERRMFPFVPDARELVVGGMAILLGKRGHSHHCHGHDCDCDCSAQHACPCPEKLKDVRTVVEFHHGDVECGDGIRVECIANEVWPDFHFGTVKAMIGPIGEKDRRGRVQLRFSPSAKHLEHIYLLCRYAPTGVSACGCDGYELT